MPRGTLRILLGAAPGVGKTFAMLEEAHTKQAEGEDVVVGLALDHGRKATAALLDGLERIPAARVEYRGSSFDELDVEAILARAPHLALVDEYAHTVVGREGHKRYQDVQLLLDAGIHVISTLNIQHLASLRDVVGQITGVIQQESVPDEVVRKADAIELVDISPELLRQRLSAGNVYAADKVDAALANYFRAGNLSALRELALLWLADRVDEGLADYRASHGIQSSWPTRERAVVGLTGGPEGEVLIRRAARILARSAGGELHAVHVRSSDGVLAEPEEQLAAQKQLLQDLGGTFHSVTGEDPAQGLLDFARSVNATQLVVGISRRRRLARLLRGSGVGSKVVTGAGAGAGDMDVHMVPHPLAGTGVKFRRSEPLGRRRVIAGFALAVILPVLLEWLLARFSATSFVTDTLLQLCVCVLAAVVGGLSPALLAAVVSSLLLNYFSAPPTGTLTIADPENLLALGIFLAVSAVVAVVVGTSARRSREVALAGAQAATLSELAAASLAGEDSPHDVLARAREYFRMDAAALLEPTSSGGWAIDGTVGDGIAAPADADAVAELGDGRVLAVRGRPVPASEAKLLAAFAAHLSALSERNALTASRQENLRLAEGNVMRTSILRAVSHDLRTPLAAIKLSATSLLQREVQLSVEDREELARSIDISADRLDDLVGNLLDMSRISADAAKPLLAPVRWRQAVESALRHVGEQGRVRVDLPANMPPVAADAGMLERVVANIVQNALKYAPDSFVVLTGSPVGRTLAGMPAAELRIIDHGRGVAGEDIVAMFKPFQRLDDVSNRDGVGLGLAVAKGFTEAMGGILEAEPTPGGGLTMVIRLPLSTGSQASTGSHTSAGQASTGRQTDTQEAGA